MQTVQQSAASESRRNLNPLLTGCLPSCCEAWGTDILVSLQEAAYTRAYIDTESKPVFF